MRIDAHQHFGVMTRKDTLGFSRTGVDSSRFHPKDLKPLLDGCQIDVAPAVQAQQSLAETAWLLGYHGAAPWIRGLVGWIDLQFTILHFN